MDNHPCETCLRWNECNGVDEQCPLIKFWEERQNEHYQAKPQTDVIKW